VYNGMIAARRGQHALFHLDAALGERPALTMIVTDHNQTLLSLPFFPGC
jgi:hypothetical protein